MALGGAAVLTGCAAPRREPKFLAYGGPQIHQVVVQKAQRRMHLVHAGRALKSYRVQLGFTAEGPKRFRGDGRTPEGRYHIDRRNPDSDFFLSIGVDYPNATDRAYAQAMGQDPGGDIFIHGWGHERPRGRSDDWTAGCVAVTNLEMREVYAMVRNGTPVDFLP